jgi:ABC-type amino acid transport substrate-binding protein
MAILPFSLNKKLVRNIGMALLTLFVLIGVARACFFSSSHPKSQYYIIARTINWRAHHFFGKEANLQAFAEEVISAAARESHLKIQMSPGHPSSLIEDLDDEKYDAVFTFMIPDSINKQEYVFSDPIYSLGSVLVVRDELTEVDSLDDMEGKIVGIATGTSSIFNLERYPNIIIVTYDNINRALSDVAQDKIDGVILDFWNAHVNAHGPYAGRVRVATLPFTHEAIRLLSLDDKEHQEFIHSLNDGMERIKASGLYKELLQKWGLFDAEDKNIK